MPPPKWAAIVAVALVAVTAITAGILILRRSSIQDPTEFISHYYSALNNDDREAAEGFILSGEAGTRQYLSQQLGAAPFTGLKISVSYPVSTDLPIVDVSGLSDGSPFTSGFELVNKDGHWKIILGTLPSKPMR
ncbi:MAG: hypothetical protein V9G19_08130 [Tetrasphaera sp.]